MPESDTSPDTTRPIAQVLAEISNQITQGKSLLQRSIFSQAELDAVRLERDEWVKRTANLLANSFESLATSEAFDGLRRKDDLVGPDAALPRRTDIFRENVERRISFLEALRNNLSSHSGKLAHANPGQAISASSMDLPIVFLVHGHDSVKYEVARVIEHLGVKVIILDEQVNQGLTVIEKFEQHAKQTKFAVVLLTPDDIAAVREQPSHTRLQARPNVLFEMGYFVARLGRGRVCLLRKGDTDIPSDLLGVIYLSYDVKDWKLKLAQELQASGLSIDLNRL